MAVEGGDFLFQAATYLGAAAIAVPLFNRFKLGSILGYLAAGMVVGPGGLNLLHQEEGVFHVAELGVVLFLFVIGLELSLSRLWALRDNIFGLGAAQMTVTGAVIAGLFVAAQVMPAPAAIIAGLSLAFSSTAFALQLMKERGELNSSYGARAFPVLLFQDLAVIPLLAAIPFLAGAGSDAPAAAGWNDSAKAAGVIVALVLIGKYALNPILRLVASSGSREAFAATALFIVAATALAVGWAGLSMALGAFLAGALLADSAYRHQIEVDIEPFRGLLLGLFFISIGMRLDLTLILDAWGVVLGGALGLVLIKMAILYALARLFGARRQDAFMTGAVLSQGGEFAFVTLALGTEAALFSNVEATLMSAIVTVSMVATPFLLLLVRGLSKKKESRGEPLDEAQQRSGHILVVGFGRMGQIISQVLGNSGFDVIAIDRNPSHIHNAQRYGFKVYYGDGARLDTLITAGALDAKAVILCMDDPASVNHAVAALRERAPALPIFAVAHDRMHEIALRPLGPDFIVRETLESSLLLARNVLERLGFDERLIDDVVQEFRKRDRERLLAQMDYGPEAGKDVMHQRFEAIDRK
ncbi:monovalent cation:proton antiporter-2 (CPA2) family protein [Amphiplicatus metriothermophilus]|uniref:Kef-type potassium/proton antiporter, CPA2 family n=1 Tax=Amphiplicatus metriothermophilus TaxID=1519374 RepID=A0A239PTY2_9PROT|nr:monovalent cation:proton antiporter-2 (CPA2) family protein [Amphiplicatus metriothermophilus]MBB5519371.1 monovalent cation:proton antiporter-2 (CPA2) family protein [Amphiplicatus metriothermophilus]SNT73493.1 Kef-type potassium/proton antiporter, CPA2 family [Amphiplicatus metriothermophilus]